MKKTIDIPESQPLRVLILEDNPADAELIERELRRAKIDCASRLVEGKREFTKALTEFKPQVILSDYKLPGFDGMAALETAQTQSPDVPFIFVSGSIGEAKAIETLTQGASDYIFKENLARLGPAVRRVVKETGLRREKERADEALRRNADEMRLLAEAADRFVHLNDLEGLYDYLAQVIRGISGADYLLLSLYDESLQAVRPKVLAGFEPYAEAVRRRLGIDPRRMAFYLKDMRPEDFADFVSRRLHRVRDGLYALSNRTIPRAACRFIERTLGIADMHTMGFSWENQLYGGVTVFFKKGNVLKNAPQVEALANLAAVAIKRLLAEKSLRTSEERFRRISETMSDISYSCHQETDGAYSLSWMTGAAEHITGYTNEEILAMRCWRKLVQDEDLADFERYVTGLAPGNNGICELRLRRKDGGTVWVQSFAECTADAEQPAKHILFGGLVDISKRKRAEIALHESEKKYRTLVTQSPDGIFVVDLKGNFLSVNQAMCSGMNYSEAELLSMKIWDIVPREYLDIHKRRLADILKGKATSEAAEYVVRGKAGETHYVEILSTPYYKDDKLIGFQGVARDITEKKKMEIRLSESEEYYRTLVQTSPDAIVIADAGGRVTFASKKTFDLFGVPVQTTLEGISILDFVDPEDANRVQARLVEILSGRSLAEIREYRLLRHDRRPFWGEISSAPLRDAQGRNIGLLLVCRDVSEHHHAQEALLRSETKFRKLFEDHAAVKLLLDAGTGAIVDANCAAAEYYGWSRDELKTMNINQINTLPPGDVAKALLTVCKEKRVHFEFRHRRADGSVRDVEVFSSKIEMEGRDFLHSIVHDITERKLAEEQVQYQAHLLQEVSDAIIATDEDGAIRLWNRAAERIYGWKAEDVIGRKFHDVIEPEYLGQSREQVQDAMNNAGEWSGEMAHRLRGGKRIMVLSTITRLKDAGGLRAGTVSVNHDISERKRTEELIRASLKEKEVLLQEIHHRVKNNLQIVSGLLTLQADRPGGKSMEEVFRESQDRIRSIALIHEKLYRSHNLAEIAFDDYLRALVDNLILSHLASAGRVTAKYDLERILFTIETAIPLGLIVNELVTNALKHAFPGGRRGEIRIGLHGREKNRFVGVKTESGTLYRVPSCELVVADDGVGLPAGSDPDKSKTLGMSLVSMLAKQLQGELKITGGPGAEFRLIFRGQAQDTNPMRANS